MVLGSTNNNSNNYNSPKKPKPAKLDLVPHSHTHTHTSNNNNINNNINKHKNDINKPKLIKQKPANTIHPSSISTFTEPFIEDKHISKKTQIIQSKSPSPTKPPPKPIIKHDEEEEETLKLEFNNSGVDDEATLVDVTHSPELENKFNNNNNKNKNKHKNTNNNTSRKSNNKSDNNNINNDDDNDRPQNNITYGNVVPFYDESFVPDTQTQSILLLFIPLVL